MASVNRQWVRTGVSSFVMQCRDCGQTKEPGAFGVNKRRLSGRCAYCKECVRARTSAWYQSNLTRERAKRLAYDRARHPRRKYGKGALGGKSGAMRSAEYRRRHPDRARAISAQWHAQAKLTRPQWANSRRIAAIYGEASRLTRETGMPHHVDHIVPLRSRLVCGLHCEANLEILPQAANLHKSNRLWPGMP
jgi:hypothetical protein